MSESLVTVLYLLSGALFILSLGGLSTQETASRGNRLGVIGMMIAMLTTALGAQVSGSGYLVLAVCVGVGASIGALLAARVEMTAMPYAAARFDEDRNPITSRMQAIISAQLTAGM